MTLLSPRRFEAADRAHLPALASLLARAFEDNPVSAYLFPDALRRRRRLVVYYERVLRRALHRCDLWIAGAASGIAIWEPPDVRPESLPARLGFGLLMVAVEREAVLRGRRFARVMAGAKLDAPHWRLALLATEPALCRRGIASSLLAPVLRRCDEDARPASLETRAENVPFYEGRGFRSRAKLAVAGGPTLVWMVRPASASAGVVPRRSGG